MTRSTRSTPLGARIGFHETQLPRSERELLAVFFDELGATVREPEAPIKRVYAGAAGHWDESRNSSLVRQTHFYEGPVDWKPPESDQPSLFDNKEAAVNNVWEASDGLGYAEGKVLPPDPPWPALVSVDAIDLSSMASHDARSLARWLFNLADAADKAMGHA